MSNIANTTTESNKVWTKELYEVLRNSLYPGASDDAIALVLSYCKATGLDPMQKSVHIVPMWDAKAKRMRDTIMPGIGLYRIQAARTGQYAGVSDAEFGADITAELDGVEVTFPQWCKVVVKRVLPNGTIAEFSATERWLENYATAMRDSSRPNAMWFKRPYGQLAKCAEAQALRKAFPEIGAQPSFEEMEGKALEGNDEEIIDAPTSNVPNNLKALPNQMSDEQLDQYLNKVVARAQEINAWDRALETIQKRYSGRQLEHAVAFLKKKQQEFEAETSVSNQELSVE